MDHYSKMRIIYYCNQFLLSGHKLGVTWLISEDSGEYVRIVPFNRNKRKNSGIEEQIAELIETHVRNNARSFDYISRGRVHYDLQTESFIGTERFLESEIFEGECNLEIKIPTDLYFNQIEIEVTGGYADPVKASVSFQLRNGTVITDDPLAQERQRLEETLSKMFKKLIPRKDLLNTSNYYKIKRKDFKRRKGFMVFNIASFVYEYKVREKRDLIIPIIQ